MSERVWWSAAEIAAAKLPGCPAVARNISTMIGRAEREAPHLVRPRAGRGGGREIHVDALPQAARDHLARSASTARAVAIETAPVPAVVERQKPPVRTTLPATSLTGRQRQIMEARAAILGLVDSAVARGEGSRSRVIDRLVEDARRGSDRHLADLAMRANDKGRGLSRRTIYDWFSMRDAGGVEALAPRPTREKEDVPAWFDAFLKFFALPTKPTLSEAYVRWTKTLPAGTAPTYAAVKRAVGKLDHLERAKGREGKLKLRERMAYTSRDTLDLLPTSVYVADGTTFDAEIEHPIHGRAFRPEITTIIDAATRRIVGWSVGLSESGSVVADAMRRAAGGYGIPAIFYTDRGSGYVNDAMDAPLTGLLARLGTTPMRALPYNSQGKGIVEAVQKLWIKVAREFVTYVGAGMDKEARQLAFRTTRREIAAVGSSRLLPKWSEFVAAVEAAIAEYDDAPHRGLPQIRDAGRGSKRHMTPREMWDQKLDAGFEPVIPDEAELADLFRPWEVRRCRRCLVTLGTNSYFSTALDPYHERDVIVGYDVSDASQVWVREIDLVDGERVAGRLIAVAEFEGNKTRYIAVSMEQQAMEKRAEGRRRRLQTHLDTVEAELRPSALLELQSVPAAPLPTFSVTLDAAPVAVAIAEPCDPAARPRFRDDIAFAAWAVAHPARLTAADRALLKEMLASDTQKRLLRMSGLDLELVAQRAIDEAA